MRQFFTSTLLFCGILFIYGNVKAQSGSGWQWASNTSIANASRGVRDLTTDASGNIYATGGYYDTLTLGGITLTGTPDHYNHVFTAKYDNSGNVIWLNQYNSGAGGIVQTAGVIALDQAGNVYIGGTDNGTAGGVGKGFVEKYDNNGNVLWRKVLLLNEVIAINAGPDGNPIVIESLTGYRNIYKLNKTDGSIIWTVQNTGVSIPIDSHKSYSNFLDSKGNVYYNLYAFPSGTNTAEVVAGQNFVNPGATFCLVSLDNNGNRRWIDSASNSVLSLPLAGSAFVDKNDKIRLSIGISVSTGGLSGTNQALTATSGYYELDTSGKVTYRSFLSPFKNAGRLIAKGDGIYSYNSLTGGINATASFGDYSFVSPPVNTTNLNVIIKYNPATFQVVWANSFETTGGAFSAGGTAAFDVEASKVIVGGNYGITAKFGSILKSATVVATNVYTKTDLFIAQFDEASVAPPPVTTWTGAAGNMNFNDPANWNNGVPNFIKAIIPGNLSNYPNNISSAPSMSRLEIEAGATIALPLAISIPNGILNNGTIEINEAGFFYGGFNTGQTLISGNGRVTMKNNGTYYFGYVVLDNSLEINTPGTVTSFGGTINGSLILTNGVYGGDIILANPNASVSATSTSYVAGKITRFVNSSGSYDFPIGSSSQYTPVTLQLNAVTGPQKISASFTSIINGSVPNVSLGGQTVSQLLNAGIWTISPDVPLTGGNYKVKLEGRGFTNSVADVTRYVVLKRANSAGVWGFFGSNGSATQTASVITATAGNVSGFSDFAIGIASASVLSTLPISYTFFSVEKDNAAVLLHWQTAKETNNSYFNVQHSNNAVNWQTLGKVNAKNTVAPADYNFSDIEPFTGINYYRLQQVDKDGKFSFSEIRRINNNSARANIILYPNPLRGNTITVDYGKQILTPIGYKIIDIGGRNLQSGNLYKRQETLFISGLTPGYYRVMLSDGQEISLLKL
jgi:hypothetical protein